ncbi:Poly [ADP-ribose] polymerase [Entamoeba marina]
MIQHSNAEPSSQGSSEEDVPNGEEMRGIYVLIAGEKKDLGMTQARLQRIIIKHSGNVVGRVSDATVMVTTYEEYKKARSVKMKQALGKITMLSPQWVKRLCDRVEGFMTLRRRVGAEKYLIKETKWVNDILRERFCCKIPNSIIQKKNQKIKSEIKCEPRIGSEVFSIHYIFKKNGFDCKPLVVSDDVGYSVFNIVLKYLDMFAIVKITIYMSIVCINKVYHYLYHKDSEPDVFQHIENENSGVLIDVWKKKYFELTGNDWSRRNSFIKLPGKYFQVKLNNGYSVGDRFEYPKPPSQQLLDFKIVHTLKCIFNENSLLNNYKQIGVDSVKLPLSFLSSQLIQNAFTVLNTLEELISKSGVDNEHQISNFSLKYYGYIPHVLNIKTLDNNDSILEKREELDALLNIKTLYHLIRNVDFTSNEQTFTFYEKLIVSLSPINHQSETYETIEKYVIQSQTVTNPLILSDAYEIQYKNDFYDDCEKWLLFIGMRYEEYGLSLLEGVKKRNKKCLRFSDCLSVFGDSQMIFLCEVALGKTTTYEGRINMDNNDFESVQLVGTNCPSTTIKIDNVIVPLGKMTKSNQQTPFDYNQYLLCDPSRVKLKYILFF